ncbi:Brain-enriched guanylate kinase-associated protein [Pteropus alecto]|uniref:Brain-enriched guanylate kinase-associated protein n=1 Tax=Pteropus alecto TaxID=9402 RepID=L5JQI6_PTEAL|nr:Brain-enriched guanylate kinase-associated protein [Pteropus alecto]
MGAGLPSLMNAHGGLAWTPLAPTPTLGPLHRWGRAPLSAVRPGSPAWPPPVLSSLVLFAHRLRSPWVPSCLGQPRVLQGRLARSSPSLWDRIQSNYMALQRINQELEDKLYRMGQHYEEEKRALSHEIVALNSHLLEAKVTIDKLSEDNALYRKDCNLAAQLLQCSQTYGRVHKVSELPSDFQERVSLHVEKQGCSLPSPLCHPAYADSVPACIIAKVLEKPDPASLSPRLSDVSARDLAFRDGLEKLGPRPTYKEDVYCSDTALYCPEERPRDRRPSVDAPVADVGFLRAQNSTDSAAEEEEEEEEAEAAAYPAAFRRQAFPGYAGSLPTSSSYSSFSATLRAKPGSARLPRWRPLSVEDIGAYSFPAAAARASPCSFSERYYGSSPGKKAEGRASPLYASYKADSFSEGDDLSQGPLGEPCFLRAGGPAEPLPSYVASEGDGERLGGQLCGVAGSPEPGPSPHSSRDSLEPSSMEASPEMHPAARLSPQPTFPRTGTSGLSRKDSLTKAQLYGTLLN